MVVTWDPVSRMDSHIVSPKATAETQRGPTSPGGRFWLSSSQHPGLQVLPLNLHCESLLGDQCPQLSQPQPSGYRSLYKFKDVLWFPCRAQNLLGLSLSSTFFLRTRPGLGSFGQFAAMWPSSSHFKQNHDLKKFWSCSGLTRWYWIIANEVFNNNLLNMRWI